MFQLDKTIVSEELFEKDFVCNLSACKGFCCVDGDAGAPVSEEEAKIMEAIYPKVKPYLTAKGKKAIEEQGTTIIGEDGEIETPLIKGEACAYVVYDEDTALCGIEQAYNEGEVSFKKPVSCHLYPVRVKEYADFAAVNYHKWHICSDACELGEELGVPVYKFVKEALIRKFGEQWYAELDKAGQEFLKK